MKIKWSRDAVRDLQHLIGWISTDSPAAAARQADKIRAATRQLVDFPHSGKISLVENIRELSVPGTSYVVLYKLHGRTVHVLRIMHGAQRRPISFS